MVLIQCELRVGQLSKGQQALRGRLKMDQKLLQEAILTIQNLFHRPSKNSLEIQAAHKGLICQVEAITAAAVSSLPGKPYSVLFLRDSYSFFSLLLFYLCEVV